MYDVRPNLILGFHGCDESTCHSLLTLPDKIRISKEKHDWLGHGMYFWENNLERALDWAKDKKERGEVEKPAVIGAIIQLGYCCDFLDSRFIKMLKDHHELMTGYYNAMGEELPENKDLKQDIYKDKILRTLDCTTIEFMHGQIEDQIRLDPDKRGFSPLRSFDTTRGVFTEGGPVFPGAGILEKNHIQICIRNLNCIKGLFLPRKEI